jgi:hypothetical protein
MHPTATAARIPEETAQRPSFACSSPASSTCGAECLPAILPEFVSRNLIKAATKYYASLRDDFRVAGIETADLGAGGLADFIDRHILSAGDGETVSVHRGVQACAKWYASNH